MREVEERIQRRLRLPGTAIIARDQDIPLINVLSWFGTLTGTKMQGKI